MGELARALWAFAAHTSDLLSEFSAGYRFARPKFGCPEVSGGNGSPNSRSPPGPPRDPLGPVPAMVESEMHDRLIGIETVIAALPSGGGRVTLTPTRAGEPHTKRVSHFQVNESFGTAAGDSLTNTCS